MPCSLCHEKGHNRTTCQTIPLKVPSEDKHYKWDYDDKGVVCRMDKKTGAWLPIEPFCAKCGYRRAECHCEACEGCGKMLYKERCAECDKVCDCCGYEDDYCDLDCRFYCARCEHTKPKESKWAFTDDKGDCCKACAAKGAVPVHDPALEAWFKTWQPGLA